MPDYAEIFDRRGHAYNQAVARFPMAREAERTALLNLVDLQPKETVADAPAGGGYVADGIYHRYGREVEVVCIEPSAKFAMAVDRQFRVIHAPLDRSGLPGESLDAVFSLAGLHHVSDKLAVYREWARLLRPGGRLAIADVDADTATATFLNTFVDKYTPGGHTGMFLRAGRLTQDLAAVGFSNVQERLMLVPWQLPDRPALIEFCRELFSIEAAPSSLVDEEICRLVGIEENGTGQCCLRWQLRYVTACLM